jgi:diguanylate cyclase (GGDEF)-like protein
VTARSNRADYTALSERMAQLLLLRVALAGMVLGWSAIRPEALGAPLQALAMVSAGYLFASVLAEWARRRAGRSGLWILSALLLFDGLYLAYAMYVTGGTQSPIRFLAYLHLVAVSLLASYRTGLKIAVWHSLLLFVVVYAQAAELLPAVDVVAGSAIAFDSLPVLNVTSFWAFALATSMFSAMNERELRQGRADLQALVDVGAKLDDVGDPVHQARIVLDGLAERFGFQRGVVLGASEESVVVLATLGTDPIPTAPTGPDAIVTTAWQRRETIPVKQLNPAQNPLLTEALPHARHLLVTPMMADGRSIGAIVVEHRSRSIFGVERRVISLLGQFAAVAALNMRNAVLLRHVQDLAERDSLTGAANRRMFQLSLERVLARRTPNPTEAVTAVLFIDLDDFKVINDTLGHAAGDALLVAVTERISSMVRHGDLVARLGGDEFAILIDDAPDLRRACALAERLVRELGERYQIGESTVSIGASVGIASGRDPGDDAAEVVRNADVAMYMAKANGKSGFAIFDAGMHAAMRERHELGAEVQRAVELDQLRLAFQPIVDLDSGRVAGLEALVRWQHPERGLMPPGQFIELAEENGAILPIGRWVLREGCRIAGAWQRSSVTPPDLFLCVNVSAREIQQPGFVAAVHETLTWAEMPSDRLTIEITETALLRATPGTIATLDALRELGVRIAIDDFGTGYFSLSHLRQFPVDVLKIASEFVQVTEGDARSSALAGGVLALSQSLDIVTVAEGIETSEQARRMRSLGCIYGQGYLFAQPVPAADIDAGVEWLLAARPFWLDAEALEPRTAPSRQRIRLTPSAQRRASMDPSPA